MRRFFFTMLLTLISMASYAEIASGECGADGDNITWVLDDDGTLTLIGSGAMEDYYEEETPWYDFTDKILNLSLDEGITTIGDYAFHECFRLTSVIIPSSVERINEYAFVWCSNLHEVIMGNGVISIGDYAFACCMKLESMTIPNSVISIGEYVFTQCSGLESIVIGNSVESIGYWAFAFCTNLKSVHISSIEAWCNIHYASYGLSNPLGYGAHLYLNGEEIIDLVIPNTVTNIGDFAFLFGIGLNSVTIPSTVMSIGEGVFLGCNNLTSIIVDENNPNYCSSGNILFNKNKTELLYAGDSKGCFVIPSTVQTIGYGAFCRCSELASVTIPNSVVTIKGRAFAGCSNITSITIPNSVTTIGEYAFNGCSNLTTVTIGNSVNSIDEYAFYSCDELKEILCRTITPPTATSNTLSGIDKKNCRLYVPEASIEVYKSSEQWGKFVNILCLEEYEMNKFRTDNAEILSKTADDVTSTDLEAIDKMLDDYSNLLETTKSKLTSDEMVLIDALESKAEEIKNRCAKPVISIVKRHLVITCATDGAQIHYTVSPIVEEYSGNYENPLDIPMCFKITAYATMEGRMESETVTATFGLSDIAGLIGDVNLDGRVSISDVNSLIDILLENQE